MKDFLTSHERGPPLYPAPIWGPLAWLVSGRDVLPEITVGLRSTLFRRMSSLVAAGIVNMAVVVFAVLRHPDTTFVIWTVVAAALQIARLGIIVPIAWSIRDKNLYRRAVLVDVFVVSSLLWSLQIGLVSAICIASSDMVLVASSVVLAIGATGALSARNPGSPRLSSAQMLLIMVPFTAGTLLNPDSTLRFLVIIMPLYVWGMLSINRLLHRDYVAMLTAQHANREQALRCGLTGLSNARSFHEHLAEAMNDPGDGPVAVLALDLDGFKGVNDRYGHPAGDELLKLVAGRLHGFESENLSAARIGGDEFALVLRGPNADAAERLADRMIREIAAPYRLSDGIVTVSASIGIALSCRGDGDPGRSMPVPIGRSTAPRRPASAPGGATWMRHATPAATRVAGGTRSRRPTRRKGW